MRQRLLTVAGRTTAESDGALGEALRAGRRKKWRLVFDWVLAMAGIGVAVWRLAPTLATVGDLGARLAAVRWEWLVPAVICAVGSLAAYGELHRRLLRSGGAHLPAGTVQAVNFIGNALAQTVPSAGATAGVAYTVAAYRRRGADVGLSLWSTTLAALLSAAVIVVIAPLVLACDGLLGWPAATALSCALAALAVAAWRLVQRPRSLHWIAREAVAVGRHLPVVRNKDWVTQRPGPAETVSDRIARLRPGPAEWGGFVATVVLSWFLDYAALAGCVAAVADTVPWPALAVGYLAVQVSIGLQLTPAGTGPAEAGLLAALTAGGLLPPAAAVVVVLYRAITWLGLASAGWRPSRWDIGFIRRFMLCFGPISSVFDFVTFGVMLWIFHAGPPEFRTGWFVESLATQTLVLFAIRTRRIPFFSSRPSLPLLLASLGIVAVGAVLPATPFAAALGFHPLPFAFFATLALMVVGYLGLVEIGKKLFYRTSRATGASSRRDSTGRHVWRRAARFSTAVK